MIDDICAMVQIDSTRGEPQFGKPFGSGPAAALEKALEICKREGLVTKNIDGYMGYGSFGESQNYIGIIGHVDVVEIGDGWIDPPFSAVIHDGRMGIRFSLTYPTCNIDKIVKQVQTKATDLEVKLVSNSPVVLHHKDSWLVKTMQKAYEEATDTSTKPTTTTGGTYAHVCDSIIPYGPSFSGQNGIAHQPNEWVNINDLVSCAKIYAWTLYKLCMAEILINPLEEEKS